MYKYDTNVHKCSAVAETGDHLDTIDMGDNWGLCPLWGEARSPCNTMWPGPRPTFVPSGILIHPAVWTIDMGRKWGALPPFWGGRAESPSNTISLGPRPTSLPSGVLTHPVIWPQQVWTENWWGSATLGEGELGPHLTQCGQSRGLPAC